MNNVYCSHTVWNVISQGDMRFHIKEFPANYQKVGLHRLC